MEIGLNSLMKYRKRYTKLVAEAEGICISIPTPAGDSGAMLVHRAREAYNRGEDVSTAIELIGRDKWCRLERLWDEMDKLERYIGGL